MSSGQGRKEEKSEARSNAVGLRTILIVLLSIVVIVVVLVGIAVYAGAASR